MLREEYITTIVVNKKMVNVGLDDYGQTYFLEYTNDNGEIVQDCVGTYETDYEGYAEMLFGDPKQCEIYNEQTYCEEEKHMYCHKCDKCYLVIEREKRLAKTKEEIKKILEEREEKKDEQDGV